MGASTAGAPPVSELPLVEVGMRRWRQRTVAAILVAPATPTGRSGIANAPAPRSEIGNLAAARCDATPILDGSINDYAQAA